MFKKYFLQRRHHKMSVQANGFLSKKISSLMTPYVVTLKPNTSAIQAATRMIAQNISCIVVVSMDDSHEVVGIITERDFIKKVPPSSVALQKKVSDFMSDKIVSVTSDITVHKAFMTMQKNNFRKLVVKDNNKLMGIVTQTDLVNYGLKMLTTFSSSRPLVRDWMTKKIVSIRPNTTFADAKKVMLKEDVGAMLVKGATYEGIFTEYDVVAQFYDQGGMLRMQSPKELMHEHIKCISMDATVIFANRVMAEKKVRRLLVVDGPKAVGIITQTDIARALVSAAEEMLNKEFLHKQETFFSLPKTPITTLYISDNFKVYG